MRILVIEDEKKTAAFLAKGLREAGFVVDVAPDGEAGLAATRASKFDLLIVDIMLPKKDGWALVEELREARGQTPVIFFPGRDTLRVPGIARPRAFASASHSFASGQAAHRRFGNRYTPSTRRARRRTTKSYAERVSPSHPSGAFGR